MADSLSRSLVDAAAEAICESVKLDLQMPHGDARTWSAETWKGEGRAAVAAVLETLAAHTAPAQGLRVAFLNHDELRRLVAEIKGED